MARDWEMVALSVLRLIVHPDLGKKSRLLLWRLTPGKKDWIGNQRAGVLKV